MKFSSRACIVVAAICIFASHAAAQNGSIEFVARVAPSGGIEEPIRGFPVYLVTKSFEQIVKEVEASNPAVDMNAFIDTLDVSKELKTWMKKNQWVQLSGEDFIHKLTPHDIVTVPEFYSAYLERSAGSESPDFPKGKYKSVDKNKDPAKYQKLSDDYRQAVERYVDQNPTSKDGTDLDLVDKDASSKWQALSSKRNPEIRREALHLAQSKYFVARTETNLQGQGFLNSVAPGNYWLSTLDVAAGVGDVRSRWDVNVTVQPGQTAYVVLSNANALQPAHVAP